MAHLIQVGAGSGGMVVLDLVCADPRITALTLIEPDIYKPHNVERHYFPPHSAGRLKADLAASWVKERRPDIDIHLMPWDVMDAGRQSDIESAVLQADIGVCAVDNEPAKYHWDALMRKFGKRWTLGEVLSGGIGGFIHRFVPDGPCYGCVASFLQRAVETEKPAAPDYANPSGAVAATTIPAGKAPIHAIAALHAVMTLALLEDSRQHAASDFTTLLMTLQHVPDVFDEPFKMHRFLVERSPECLICQQHSASVPPQELDHALNEALVRLGHA